ncbi:hypothetical protein [Paenibacillus sp. GCM10027626]|uniref:hypothetical protein n=1 Tax=Paenibacillus sp. GCM10027626 TaxID=3273411 RepID=UPI00363AB25B
MIGSWRLNIAFGLCGAILTAIFAWNSNGFALAMLRSVYAFIAFFAIAYIFRIILAAIVNPQQAFEEERQEDEPELGTKGSVVDLTTPEEEEDLGALLKPRMEEELSQVPGKAVEFKPLQPEQLFSKAKREPEEMAKAVRHLTGG